MDITANVTCDSCKVATVSVVANNPAQQTFNLAIVGWFQLSDKHYCTPCIESLKEAHHDRK